MSRTRVVGAAAAAIVAAMGLAASLLLKTGDRPAGEAASGVLVTVLVDFSRSFIPIAAGGKSAGLLEVDRAALRALAASLARLAWDTWKPPVTIVWSPITEGAIVAPLCEPLVVNNDSPVAKAGTVSRPEEIEKVLFACIDEIARTSRDAQRLAPFTDVSAAIAGASASSDTPYAERIVVVLSDLREDLAKGRKPAPFDVTDHKVVLLHRPGTDEPEAVIGYLARINSWKQLFRARGAEAVAAMPVFAASKGRVSAALHGDAGKPMTSLTVLVDPRTNVSTAFNRAGKTDALRALGRELAVLPEANGWKPPVITQWVVVTNSALRLRTDAPVDFDPTPIIPKPGETSRKEDLLVAMDESARWAATATSAASDGDLAGSVALLTSAEPLASAHIVVILSDFANAPLTGNLPLPRDSRFVLLHAPGPNRDVNEDRVRRGAWEQMFKASGATRVCPMALALWTSVDLAACLNAATKKFE